jgi:hypothetical protein
MDFKQAWRALGNPTPGNTTWSADVGQRPVFTAWRELDFKFDKEARRSKLYSPPSKWAERGEGQSYLRRAKLAQDNNWVCRLILLEGREPWQEVRSASFDPVLHAVRFTEVADDGTLEADVLTRSEYLEHIRQGNQSDA